VLPLAALIASLVRWWLQGSGNLYTARAKRFYVEDPDLGWRALETNVLWVGLEVCAVILALVIGLAIGGWIIRARERKTRRSASVLRALAWGAAIIPLIIPLTAFARGWGPSGARDVLPAVVRATPGPPAGGIAGSLGAPAGRYEVVAHEGTSITAQLKSGGEAFDARFARDITGSWQGDTSDLAKPITAEIRAASAAVDTGISGRSTSARETYLAADKHPHITFALGKLGSAQQTGDKVAFGATGTLGFIGKTHTVEVTGTLRKADTATLGRLQLAGDVLLVQADFSIIVKETGLAPNAGDFDGDRIPIHVSLVLRRTGE
jgi:polyisoprenoid-binding protein YceI